MPQISSSLSTPQPYIPMFNATQLAKLAGVHIHFPTLAALNVAVAAERTNITAVSPIWAAGQPFSAGDEPVGVMRNWFIGGSAAASHGRTVRLRAGMAITLAADTNTVIATTGAPTGGADGDVAVDYVGNAYYTRSAGSWSSAIALTTGPAQTSQAEAEAGVENTKFMTSLRTAQAIAAPLALKADALAPVDINASTVLSFAAHANRQLRYSGADSTKAIPSDAGTSDASFEIVTLAGSAGVPTLTTPDGKSIVGAIGKTVGATRKGANVYDVGTTDQSFAGMTFGFHATFPVGADETFVLDQFATFPYTINSTVSRCDSGTATYRPQIEGVNVGSTANAVTTAEQMQAHTTANTVAIGNTVTLVRSVNATCVMGRVKFNCTRLA